MKQKQRINRGKIRKRLIKEISKKGIIAGYDGRKLAQQKVVDLGRIYNQLIGKEVDLTRRSVWEEFEYLSLSPNGRASNKKPKIQKPNKKKEPHWKDKYLNYLKSKEWKAIRVKLFALRGRKCEECGDTKFLQIHHKTYIRLYHEKMDDLQILCRKCHKEEHNIK